MSTVHNVFNQLVASPTRSIIIATDSLRAHDNLRTRLVKLFSRHKDLLTSIGAGDDDVRLSLSADFSADSGTSKFTIRIRRTKYGDAGEEGMKEYTIVSS